VTNERVEDQSVVFVVEDDQSLRETLLSLFESVGLHSQGFGSATEFLEKKPPHARGCLVLDVRLPGPGGLEFQSDLAKANINIPIIFMTGHGDIPMSVRAMKAGAVEFLTKPFREQDMLDAVRLALERDRSQAETERAHSALKSTFETLTPREQEIMALVTAGLLNKQIAGKVGISEVTVKIHRGNVMRKMGAKSLADLVRMAETIRPARRVHNT
jgi:FixJ family two-component response regulator